MRIEGHNPVNNKISLAKEVAWASQNMPRTLRQVAALPDLSGVRLACCMHLDMKMIPLVQGILDKGAQVFLTTCNPTTVQDDVVASAGGARRRGLRVAQYERCRLATVMGKSDCTGSPLTCARWAPISPPCSTSAASLGTSWRVWKPPARASIGWGIFSRGYPIFNWDDLPVKEGLHNRHMVGLTAPAHLLPDHSPHPA